MSYGTISNSLHIWSPKVEETKKVFEEIMAECFPNLKKNVNPQDQRNSIGLNQKYTKAYYDPIG